MPHKFNAARRHKFTKRRYRVTNWAEYNESLRKRGDLTVWFTAEALDLWAAPRRVSRGGQPRYSEMTITICLTLGVVFKQPLRQTQGLMRSLARLMGLDISVPDFSTLSRRGRGLRLPAKSQTRRDQLVHLVVDSTGLDLVSGEIICAELTLDDVGDPTALLGLLDQVDDPVSRFLADGAYDGAPTSGLLRARFGGAVEIIIPPPKNAIPNPQSRRDPSQRDQHIAAIQPHGRIAWQSSSGYNQRSRGETQIGRWKGVIGAKLKARCFENQKAEVRIGVTVLNKMTKLGRPEFEAVM